ncbi:MAG TPA: succinate dehydrogenase/fumarate reductase iron-sulfur subunit [Planctomycetota bacterium]|jgi:succinate dehydrogenase / fumarate reductase iron-sulfur subunit|nr:succinate dehydrogenase/fumarate reductase iron-sulfur subunit [Planctomycetota bacterium]
MDLVLKVWRQKSATDTGHFDTIEAKGISEHMSFLEMLDVVNESLVAKNKDPIAFDHDCREGICGMCSLVINGRPHGPDGGTTTCQLHMRRFASGDTITIEPFRARAFPVIRDLVVNRSAFDRIIQSGGYVSVSTGGTPDANEIPIPKSEADVAFDAAACIGCGACVAACKNASAMLFVSAKAAHLSHLPQGQPERLRRAEAMVLRMDEEGFGSCTNTYDCEAACPKEISVDFIGELNRDFRQALLSGRTH